GATRRRRSRSAALRRAPKANESEAVAAATACHSFQISRGISRDDAAGGDVAYDVATEPDQRFVADSHAIHDGAAATDIAVLTDGDVSRNRDVRADHAPCADHRVVMNDRVRKHADVIIDSRVSGNHD